MFFFDLRDILEILRGSSRPGPLVAACVLGTALAFVPQPLGAGLGLVVALLALLCVINANVGLALLIWAPMRLLALALMSVSFGLGRFLVDGPLHGPVAWAANAPLLALLGLERYATVGGLVLALIGGLAVGIAAVRAIAAFRRRMARLEAESAKFDKVKARLENHRALRVLLWLFAGGKDDERSYQELLEAGRERPWRLSGLVVVAVFALLAWLFPATIGGPLLRPLVHEGLQDMNGATVDLDEITLDPRAGRLVISGLAMADAEDLGRDVFRASRIEADVAIDDLLRKRMVIDRVVVIDGLQGAARDVPGERIGKPPKPRGDGDGEEDDDDVTLEDILEDYDEWEERLARYREWLERIAGGEPDDEGDWEDDLERQIEREGWAGVIARGLVDEVPSLLISELVADGVRTDSLGDELVDVRASNLSTHPHLVDAPPRITINSRGGTLLLDLGLGGLDSSGGANGLEFRLRGLSADRLASGLKLDGEPLVRGGTLDLDLAGSWSGGEVGKLKLPFSITLHDVTAKLFGELRDVQELQLPFKLRGSLDAPRVKFERSDLDDALREAAEAGLVDEARQRLGAELGVDPDALGDDLQGALEDALDGEASGLGGLLGGLLDDDDDDESGGGMGGMGMGGMGMGMGGMGGAPDDDTSGDGS